MKWNRFTIKTVTQAEDILISGLADIGIEGVEILDKQPMTEEEKAQMFVDIVPEGPEDDGIAYLSFYLEEEADTEALLAAVEEVLRETRTFMDIGEGSIERSQTEDKDWVNNWKEYFHQFYVDDFLIVPSWEEVKKEDQGKMILHIDPGTAFGTGMHETTQLCIRQLKKRITPGCTLLDVGTGSGILGIAAYKLGASYCLGTDLDSNTVSAVEENLAANGVPETAFTLKLGNLIDDEALQQETASFSFDLVTANILHNVLVPLTPVVTRFMKEGAYYITSGILEGKEGLVEEACISAGLRLVEVTRQGEWMCVVAQK